MNHFEARNEVIEKIEKTEKPMVSPTNDTPQSLDAEKLANESADVKVTKWLEQVRKPKFESFFLN